MRVRSDSHNSLVAKLFDTKVLCRPIGSERGENAVDALLADPGLFAIGSSGSNAYQGEDEGCR